MLLSVFRIFLFCIWFAQVTFPWMEKYIHIMLHEKEKQKSIHLSVLQNVISQDTVIQPELIAVPPLCAQELDFYCAPPSAIDTYYDFAVQCFRPICCPPPCNCGGDVPVDPVLLSPQPIATTSKFIRTLYPCSFITCMCAQPVLEAL